ncbi:hypothetical protein KC19_3G238700 [Ceratodon purpureus]|uniref:Uncharacterized protein n=1 Tax=Ceratodon purpureus TaxID=3225 RepID=A0A8T0IM42_CERPU|nr:hypothetical protein KC19_3G238700 [Ceratodon purpureus]
MSLIIVIGGTLRPGSDKHKLPPRSLVWFPAPQIAQSPTPSYLHLVPSQRPAPPHDLPHAEPRVALPRKQCSDAHLLQLQIVPVHHLLLHKVHLLPERLVPPRQTGEARVEELLGQLLALLHGRGLHDVVLVVLHQLLVEGGAALGGELRGHGRLALHLAQPRRHGYRATPRRRSGMRPGGGELQTLMQWHCKHSP